jgi:HEAT repeat protein
LFVGLTILYFTSVFFFRNKISSKQKKVKEKKKQFSPMISEFLFFEADAPKDEKSNYVDLKIEIRELIKDRLHRKVLTEILLDLRKDVSGETQKRLFRLYQDLGLHKDAFKKLKSWRWQIISKGIYELAQMQVAESYGFIKRFINDKRGTIRKQAEIAIITLNTEGLNYFLDTTEYRISEWQQLKLLDVIRNQDDFQPPRFKAWLISSNKHVVLFALRLIKYYNQNDAFASITELVKHRNDQIKKEAISCIKEFHVKEALPTLKIVFWKCSVDIKIAILDAIAELGTSSDLNFLRSIDKKESNFSVRSKALGSINAIAPESVIPTRGIVQIKGNQIPKDIVVNDLKDEEHQIEQEIESFIEEPDTHFELNPADIIKEKGKPIVSEEMHTPFDLYEQELQTDQVIGEEEPIEESEIPSDIDVAKETNQKKEQPHKDSVEENDELFEVGELEQREITDLNETPPTLNLRFLPIVVNADEIEDKVYEAKDTSLNINEKEQDITVNAMYEAYDHAPPTSVDHNIPVEEKEEIEINDEFDPIELAFLPLVVKNETIGEEKEIVDKEQNELITQQVNENDMLENRDLSMDFELNGDDTPFFDFLPFVTESEAIDNEDAMPFNEFIDSAAPNTEEDHEAIKTGTTESKQKEIEEDSIEWPMDDNDIPFSSAMGFASFEDVEDNISEDTKSISQETLDILAGLPKPKYYDGETMITMRLLDDIEELGDQREIPLLKELRSKSNHVVINNRIEQIMQQFKTREPKTFSKDTIASINDEFKPFSVFEDLFRTCDIEAKLILIDEVVVVGDEKELGFLEELTKDPNPELREKAIKVLEALDNRLFQENLSFDPSETFITDTPNIKSGHGRDYNSMFEQLLSIPTKIIEKING